MLLLLAAFAFAEDEALPEAPPAGQPSSGQPSSETDPSGQPSSEAEPSGQPSSEPSGQPASEAAPAVGWSAPPEAFAANQGPPPGAVIGDETFPQAIDPQVARRYRKLRLRVVDEPDGSWVVRDGQGFVLDTHTFAHLTNDATGRDRLEAGRHEGRRNSLIVAGVGAALAASAVIPLALLDDVSPINPEDYWVNPSDFATEQEYLAAQSDAEARRTLAQGAVNTAEGRNEDLRWTSLMLVSAGTLALAVSPTPWELAIHRQGELSRFYTRDEVERRVAAYNRAVRARLAMPEPLPPPDAPAEDEASSAWTPLPGGERRASLTPVIGPTYLGLTLRF